MGLISSLTLSLPSTSKNQYLSATHVWRTPEYFHRMLLIYKTFSWTNNNENSHVTFGGHFVYEKCIYATILYKNWRHPSTQSIRHNILYCSIRNKSKYSSWRALCVMYVIPLDLFSLLWRHITNIFVKSILVQKNCVDFHIWYYYVPWTFWNKEQLFASLITVKSRQLLTVPINFDCSRVWQWTVNSTTAAFGSESDNLWIFISWRYGLFKQVCNNVHINGSST